MSLHCHFTYKPIALRTYLVAALRLCGISTHPLTKERSITRMLHVFTRMYDVVSKQNPIISRAKFSYQISIQQGNERGALVAERTILQQQHCNVIHCKFGCYFVISRKSRTKSRNKQQKKKQRHINIFFFKKYINLKISRVNLL